MGTQYEHLNREERDKIAVWKAEGWSIRKIGRQLQRNPGTICRELNRNSPQINKGYYLPSKAQERADVRKKESGYRQKLKNKNIRDYVLAHLRIGWSPELIAGRIDKEHAELTISHEAIYQYIYKQAPYLRYYLPRKHRKRWEKGHSRKHQRFLIPHRVSISKRSPQVNKRMRFGHWESDTMEGRRSETAALNVLVERKSRIIRLTKITDRTSSATKSAIIDKMKALPRRACKSITYDNGHENSEHYKVNRKFRIRSYFCDAYCSWQKGSVEQSISLVRRFIPKGWDITCIPPKHIAKIEDLLNQRPRKCLDFATPAEIFEKLGVALPP